MEKPIQLKDIIKTVQEIKPSEVCKEIELTEEEQKATLKAAGKAKRIRSEDPLTEDEIEFAFMEARKTKRANQNMREYVKKVYGKNTEYKKWTAKELWNIVTGYLNSLVEKPDGENKLPAVNKFNRVIIWNLCLYFSGDNRCSYNLNKGLLMYGPTGCGKTTLLEIFRYNQVCGYSIVSTHQISADYSKDGQDVINRYKYLLKCTAPEKNYGQTELGVCFDDLGWEVNKKHYGNESNVMAEILFNRYLKRKDMAAKTHATTNLTVDELEERYGYRIRSRLREMFNVVEFDPNTPDRRK